MKKFAERGKGRQIYASFAARAEVPRVAGAA